VTVSKAPKAAAGMSADKPNADYGKAMMQAAMGTKSQGETEPGGIPAKYKDAKTSGLEKTVTKQGPNQFEFKLE